jgi:glycosyltransferase involved in cell wall biosynthesis
MKLTIYIPTFKRQEIEHCLGSIVPQLVDGVEVLVSDNDGFAEQIVRRFPQVQYTKQRFNIEGDQNVLRGVACGTGEYIWVFGDDDTMLPGTIDRLLPMLDGVDRIIHWSQNAKEVSPGFAGSMASYIDQLGDKSILVASTLITANVWRRDIMDLAKGLRTIDTKYPLLWAGVDAKTVKVMPHPTITVGYVHQNRFDFFAEVMTDYILGLQEATGCKPFPPRGAFGWNFVNVSLR